MLDQLVSLRWQHLDVKWMDGVVKRRHRNICKSVLFAQLHSLSNDFIRHGSSELIHSDNVSRILSGKSLPQTNKVYYHAFDLTRNIASTLARPAAIEGAADTFPSLIQVYLFVWFISKYEAL